MGTLNEDLTAIKAVEDTLTGNKVSRFGYTEYAYEHDDADGVSVYNFDNEQNIPTSSPSVMKVNQTVVDKGWRSQASSITRMLMNHFLGRLSYNVNKLTDNMLNLLTTFKNHLGTANGLATLDANGRIPYSQLPESAIEYKGQWNASTNTPTLADGTGTKGDFYIVSVAGTQNLGSGNIQFFVNDRVIYDGSVWNRLSAGDVKTVNSKQPVNGNVSIYGTDIPMSSSDVSNVCENVNILNEHRWYIHDVSVLLNGNSGGVYNYLFIHFLLLNHSSASLTGQEIKDYLVSNSINFSFKLCHQTAGSAGYTVNGIFGSLKAETQANRYTLRYYPGDDTYLTDVTSYSTMSMELSFVSVKHQTILS